MSATKQPSFSLGELTPSLYARSDLARYYTGLRTCRNHMVMRQGGLQNRPGSLFVGECADSTRKVRLIPFVFSRTQAYVLEFFGQGGTYLKFRPYQDGEPFLESPLSITAIPNQSAVQITAPAHGLSLNDEVYISGIVGMTELNGKYYRVVYVDPNTIRIRIKDDEIGAGTFVDTTSYGVYVSGGTIERIYTVTTPVTTADEDYLAEFNFAQSADVMTIVHPSHYPIEIARLGDTNWTSSFVDLAPGIDAPASVSAIVSSGGSGTMNGTKYQVTAVAEDTLEESLPTETAVSYNGTIPDISNPWVVSWTPVVGAQSYNIYRSINANGIFGYVGSADDVGIFRDTVDVPDFDNTPPIDRDPFDGTDNHPSAVAYHQQRLVFANSNNFPERIWTSKIGFYKNFTIRSPLVDDDAITFQVSGNEVNPIRHVIALKRLAVMTESGEWSIEGNDAGTIIPDAINPKQHSYNGSGKIRPLIVNGTLLYIQLQGSAIRDLAFSSSDDGYSGSDLTIYSSHLFDGNEIVDWAFQQIPNSIVWAVRDDGVLLGFTYIPEQEMYAWHRHDFTDGIVENVCSIPEGEINALYLVVRRTIDGITRRYIERFSIRFQRDQVDYVLMDSALSYDGRNTDEEHFMNITGGSTWSPSETLTLRSSDGFAPVSFFESSDVGNQFFLYDSDEESSSFGTRVVFTVTGFTDDHTVTGNVNITVPTNMRLSHFLNQWSRAVDQVSGLDHLEGKNVSVSADGFVIASPNNSDYSLITVTDGTVTLPEFRAVIHVGLPFISDVETLDIDTSDGETLSDKNKLITAVSMFVEKSDGIWVGRQAPAGDDELEDLREMDLRSDESADEPTELKTEVIEVTINGEWNSNGRVFIRQVDPLPLTILSITPAGFIPKAG